jgi:hypothetical protein
MIKNKIVVAILIVFAGSVFAMRACAEDVISQSGFSGSESEGWGSYAAASRPARNFFARPVERARRPDP